jgi:hypothetical protein
MNFNLSAGIGLISHLTKGFSGCLNKKFHSSRLLLNRWQSEEDEKLQTAYDELGPSWDLIASRLPGRKSKECRRRIHKLLPPPSHVTNSDEMKAHLEGLEFHSGKWIDVPLETKGARTPTFYSFLPNIPFVKSRSQRKRAGWHFHEDLALQEAYEHYGTNWEYVAAEFRHRTPTQCRNRLTRIYRSLNFNRISPEENPSSFEQKPPKAQQQEIECPEPSHNA